MSAGLLASLLFSFSSIIMAQGITVLNPGKFLYAPNDSCYLSLTLPFNDSPVISIGDTTSILQLKYYSPNGYDYDLADHVDNGIIKMDSIKGGSHVIILHKKNKATLTVKELEKFVSDFNPANGNQLLKAATGDFIKINLHENNKTIFQAGNYYTENATSSTTLPLEIVPVENFYQPVSKSQKTGFRVLFRGEPVPNANITMVYKKDEESKPVVQSFTTGKNGKINAVITPSGTYLMSYSMIPKIPAGNPATWQAYATTLLWGYLK